MCFCVCITECQCNVYICLCYLYVRMDENSSWKYIAIVPHDACGKHSEAPGVEFNLSHIKVCVKIILSK